MILTIHQPEFLPWPGFFHKMALADHYVVLDSVQYEKNYFQNRNKIRSDASDGWTWITLPILQKDRSAQLIKDVECNPLDARRQQKNWRTIEQNYRKAAFFNMYADRFREVFLDRQYEKLIDINLDLIAIFRDALSINTPMTLASDLSIELTQSELLAQICVELGAETYLSGPHGRDYLDASVFGDRSIGITFHEFDQPEYSQIHGDFVPYMSTLDLLFNHGPESAKILGLLT